MQDLSMTFSVTSGIYIFILSSIQISNSVHTIVFVGIGCLVFRHRIELFILRVGGGNKMKLKMNGTEV